jgi:hypothetical protein
MAAFQSYEVEGVFWSALYLPDQTVTMARDSTGQWQIVNRDQHNFGQVPVVRFSHRARSSDREGRSAITPAIRNATDAATRSLLGMDVAREVYSVPHLWILGGKEDAFVNPDGSQKSAIDIAISKFRVIERDEEGEIPTLQQIRAFDPSVFTKIVDVWGQAMSTATGFPPSYFGLSTTANPASADAIRVAEQGIVRAADRVQLEAAAPMRQLAQLMWRFAHDGAALPDALKQVEVDWLDTASATPAATTDALSKQVATGMVPATSDVVLKKAGYSAVDRKRLAQDRESDPTWQLLKELGSQVAGKDVISALRLLKATGQPVPQPDDTATPADVPAEPAAALPPQSR